MMASSLSVESGRGLLIGVKFKVVCPLLAFLILSLSSGFEPVIGILRILHSCCSSLVDLFARDDDVIFFISLFFFTGGYGEGVGCSSVRVLGVVLDGVPPPLWLFSQFLSHFLVGCGLVRMGKVGVVVGHPWCWVIFGL